MFFKVLLQQLDLERDRNEIDLSNVELTHYRLGKEIAQTMIIDESKPIPPITASGTGHVNDPERAKLSEIVERLNEIFGADTTEEDKLSWIKTKQRKLEESAILIEQAMSNTREQLASSKDLMHELLRAVMKSDDAQSTLSRQVLSSPKKQEEILNLMFDIGGLYDRLREKGTNAVQ